MFFRVCRCASVLVCQWMLSVPKRLRYFMQRDGAVLNMVLRIFLRVIAQSLQTNSPGAASVDKAALHIGAIAFIHRFDRIAAVVPPPRSELVPEKWTPRSLLL